MPEFTIQNGFARVDIAVLGEEMHGYEIKGDLDSLIRLERQREAYNSVFDKVTLVIGKKHLLDALRIVPDWWGIMIAKSLNDPDFVSLIEIREPLSNPSQDYLSIANLLWKEEILNILHESNRAKGLSNKPKKEVCQKFVEAVKIQELKTNVVQSILTRHSSHLQFA